MISDELYYKAFDYFDTKLWDNLYDADLFAVEFSDKEIGYCSVMGRQKACTSLAVYVGHEGLASFYKLMASSISDNNDASALEILLAQDCIQCSLENKTQMFPDEIVEFKNFMERMNKKIKGQKKYIHFSRYSPNCVPWYVKGKKDLAYIEQALEAAIEVAKRLKEKTKTELGFPDDEQEEMQRTIPLISKRNGVFEWSTAELPETVMTPYFEPKLSDEAVEEVSSFKRHGTIECKVFRLPFPLQNKKTEVPRYPSLILAIDRESDMIVSKPTFVADDNEELKLFDSFVKSFVSQNFLPEKIIAFDDRTINLLKNFCFQTGTLMSVEPVHAVDYAFSDMIQHMGMSRF